MVENVTLFKKKKAVKAVEGKLKFKTKQEYEKIKWTVIREFILRNYFKLLKTQ